MNKTLTLIVLAISSLVFTGCMKVSKKNASPQISEVKSESSPSTPSLEPLIQVQKKVFTKLEFDITGEEIQFYFPPDWPEALFVEVVDNDQHTTIPLNLNPEKKYWSFRWPSKDRKFGFIFRSSIDKNVTLLKTLEALPPLDITTSEHLDLVAKFAINSNFEKIVFNRLNLLKNAKLYLSTFSGEVILNEVFSEYGSIQTFPTNAKAGIEQDGVSGGRVEFKILSGEGHLSLFALGQHGGDGSTGPVPDETLRGRQGEPGRLPEFSDAAHCNPVSNEICFGVTYACIKDPTNSSTGYQGLRGYRGYPGRNGGNSGLYSISVNSSDVKINILAKEGKGGRGGSGGEGGEGGYGGQTSDGGLKDLFMSKFKYNPSKAAEESERQKYLIRISPLCNLAQVGEQGPKGPPGDFGSDGLDGVNELLVLKN